MVNKSFLGASTLVGAAGLGLAFVIMLALTPQALGPLGVTAWFLLLLAGLTGLLILAAYAAGVKLQPKRTSRQQVTDAVRRGLFVGGYSTIIFALSSLQQLNLRDGLLLLLLVVLAEFYMVART